MRPWPWDGPWDGPWAGSWAGVLWWLATLPAWAEGGPDPAPAGAGMPGLLPGIARPAPGRLFEEPATVPPGSAPAAGAPAPDPVRTGLDRLGGALAGDPAAAAWLDSVLAAAAGGELDPQAVADRLAAAAADAETPLQLTPESFGSVRAAIRAVLADTMRESVRAMEALDRPDLVTGAAPGEGVPVDPERRVGWMERIEQEAAVLGFLSNLMGRLNAAWEASEALRGLALEARVAEIRRGVALQTAIAEAETALYPAEPAATVDPAEFSSDRASGALALVLAAARPVQVEELRVEGAGAAVLGFDDCTGRALGRGGSCVFALGWTGPASGAAVARVTDAAGSSQVALARFAVGGEGPLAPAPGPAATDPVPAAVAGDRVVPPPLSVMPDAGGSGRPAAGGPAVTVEPATLEVAARAGSATLVVQVATAGTRLRGIYPPQGLRVRDDRCGRGALAAGSSCALVFGWSGPVAAGVVRLELQAGGVGQVAAIPVSSVAADAADAPLPWIDTVRVRAIFEGPDGPRAELLYGDVALAAAVGQSLPEGWRLAVLNWAARTVELVHREGLSRVLQVR